jgi:hypothetical protein
VIQSADRVAPLARPVGARGAWRGVLEATARADALAAGGLALASLIFYYPLVVGHALVDYDAFVFFYPQRAYLGAALRDGRLPLWDPLIFLGVPFLANPQTAVLYPPSWLFALGSVESMYTVQLVMHAFLAALFTYLLARHAFGVAPLAACLGGLAYAFGGFAVGQVGHLNQISAAAWLPGVLLAYDRFVVTGRRLWIALGAAALALQLLAGHPQETYMTLIVLGLFGVVRAPWTRPGQLAGCAVAGAVLCLLGAAVAAAQLLPTLELAPLSIRGAGVNWRDAVAGSLPTYLAVRAVLPPFWIQVPNTEYLGYTGVTTVALGLLALVVGRARPVVFAATLCGLGILLALGENSWAYGLAFNAVPSFDTFRVPARWLLLWIFGASLLGALGADWVARGGRRPLSRVEWLRLPILLVVLVFALNWQLSQGEPFPQRRTPLMFAAIALGTLLLAGASRIGRAGLATGALVLLAGAELWVTAEASPARRSPPAAYTAGETVDWLRSHGVTSAERLLSLARPEYVPSVEEELRASLASLPSEQLDNILVAQKWHDTLTPNVAMQFGLNTADGYDGGVLPLLRWLRLSSLVVRDPRPDGVMLTRLEDVPDDRTLDLLGVRYIISNDWTAPRPDFQSVDFGDLRLQVRPSPVPRSLLVTRAWSVVDEDMAVEAMRDPRFDPNREVVIGEPGLVDAAADSPLLPVMPVTPEVDQPERFVARVAMPQPGYLLQREAWYPGWRARVDGVETPLVRADLLFRAVPLTAGEHTVEVFFDSGSFKRGALVSVLGLLGLLVLAVSDWAPGRRFWRARPQP